MDFLQLNRKFFYSGKHLLTYLPSSGKTRQYFGTNNFFGGDRVTNVGSSERLQSLEIQSENSVCVLSDVRFDSISCVSKLNKLVEGFSGRVPKKEFSQIKKRLKLKRKLLQLFSVSHNSNLKLIFRTLF